MPLQRRTTRHTTFADTCMGIIVVVLAGVGGAVPKHDRARPHRARGGRETQGPGRCGHARPPPARAGGDLQ